MRRSTRLLLLLSLLTGLLVAGMTATPAQAATDPPVVSCEVDYVIAADWGTAHQAMVVVTNTGTVPVWWYVLIRFDPANYPIQVWNAQATAQGNTWLFEPLPWNSPPPLLPGQSASFGIVVAGPPNVPHIEVICRAA